MLVLGGVVRHPILGPPPRRATPVVGVDPDHLQAEVNRFTEILATVASTMRGPLGFEAKFRSVNPMVFFTPVKGQLTNAVKR